MEGELSDALGVARVTEDSAGSRPALVLDGPCVDETLRDLEAGRRGSPIPRPALEAIRSQANDIIGDIVSAYATRVAAGEVGQRGSARATAASSLADECPTGLLYGRVQSGKTAAMIVTTALALDNGFRVIVVLTSNNLELVSQTARRFEALSGPLIFSSRDAGGGDYPWDRDEANVRRFIGNRGVIFVCAKEDEHLRALIRFLQVIEASRFPALIMDDEADQATPDTTTARRARGNYTPNSSTTFRLVVGNDVPGEAGLSLRETLRHNVFLQVTATPYCLLLQNLESPLRPEFTNLLRPGDGYTGGDAFFENTVDPPRPPLHLIAETESASLRDEATRAPEGLARSIMFFLVSASAHALGNRVLPRDGYKYLCHTSVSKAEHDKLAELIRKYVDEVADALDLGRLPDALEADIQWALEELSRSVEPIPSRADVLSDIGRHLPRRKILIINSERDRLEYGPRHIFIVGGNILGRGLTIDDLLVTYYLRQPRVTQMDTMHQHARMFGYRRHLLAHTRVFLPPSLANRFRSIHEGEKALRDFLDEEGAVRAITVEVAGSLRATRRNILDVGNISAYRPGQQVYPVEPIHDPSALGTSISRIDNELRRLAGADLSHHEFIPISIGDAANLVRMVIVQPDNGEWDEDAVPASLLALRERFEDRAFLYIRDMARTNPPLSSGALSSREQDQARGKNGPVLFMMSDNDEPRRGRESPWGSRFWYPTVVFPRDMPALIFNRSA